MITELLLSLFIGAIIYMGISWLLKNQLEGKIEPLVDFNSQTRILSVSFFHYFTFLINISIKGWLASLQVS